MESERKHGKVGRLSMSDFSFYSNRDELKWVAAVIWSYVDLKGTYSWPWGGHGARYQPLSWACLRRHYGANWLIISVLFSVVFDCPCGVQTWLGLSVLWLLLVLNGGCWEVFRGSAVVFFLWKTQELCRLHTHPERYKWTSLRCDFRVSMRGTGAITDSGSISSGA